MWNKNKFGGLKTNGYLCGMDLKKIDNIRTYQGGIPSGYDLVVYEDGDEETIINSAATLYGFDEVGMFDSDFENPKYGFMKL